MSIGRVYTYKLNDEYELVCWGYSTSSSWGHEARLLKNGYEFASAKIRYYNRTWERFEFESVMYSALENYKASRLNDYLDDYKYKHDLKGYKDGESFEKPFPKGVKKQVVDEFNAQPIWQELHDCIENQSWKH